MKEKTIIIWSIIAGLICGTILWVFTSSLIKDDSPIIEGSSIEEYEQQMFEEIPEEEVNSVLETMNEEQLTVVDYLMDRAAEDSQGADQAETEE